MPLPGIAPAAAAHPRSVYRLTFPFLKVCSQAEILWADVWRFLASGFRFLCLLKPEAGDVQLEDHAVMHESVDGGRRGHRVLEDRFPFAERQVAG